MITVQSDQRVARLEGRDLFQRPSHPHGCVEARANINGHDVVRSVLCQPMFPVSLSFLPGFLDKPVSASNIEKRRASAVGASRQILIGKHLSVAIHFRKQVVNPGFARPSVWRARPAALAQSVISLW